ncbi:mucosa-associated lymphoid tissue lymphoma translocation protein 1-like isoform X2 [Pezoporus flaviventris]|uniref:mucosa-associated lymphoid tissue lymphoma translocation protein 1-like isoform X2 n=1 Tax=Pezoporus flaviventris TaxID=889875 RepID=UPI002AAF2AEC|nr:mucosa-associated lymphoid tissue lymphoma translocation protein 1-like isoform X2 [Pezoporus flaviventris]
MGDWSSPISSLGGEVLARLCQLLDITGCGWRRLAEVAAVEKRFSEEELEMCSLKVLEPHGSPAQSLLQLLAERNCTLQDLLGCLERMGHMQACHVLSSAVQDTICIVEQPESQVVAEGTHVSLSCRAAGSPGLTYQWFCGRQEVPGATSPELVMDTAALRGRSEWFICRVNRGNAFTFSQWVCVQVERSSLRAGGPRERVPRLEPVGHHSFPSGMGWLPQDIDCHVAPQLWTFWGYGAHGGVVLWNGLGWKGP